MLHSCRWSHHITESQKYRRVATQCWLKYCPINLWISDCPSQRITTHRTSITINHYIILQKLSKNINALIQKKLSRCHKKDAVKAKSYLRSWGDSNTITDDKEKIQIKTLFQRVQNIFKQFSWYLLQQCLSWCHLRTSQSSSLNTSHDWQLLQQG